MDTKKIGSFLKQLRKEKEMTQEQLGEKVGVSNKTVSRWETGNYMPPIECLAILSDIYDISINEILVGERTSQEEFAEIAEKNITAALKELEQENQIFEKRMKCIWAISTVSCIIIISLLSSLLIVVLVIST